MKTLSKGFLSLLLLSFVCLAAIAQNTKSEKKAAHRAAIKNMVERQNFFFEANYALPQRGGTRVLTSVYDLKVSKDSIISHLPFFGRAYMAPIDPTEGGIDFTTTKFSYTKIHTKNGGWDITIRPLKTNPTDWRDVQQMRLNISPDGYATLSVLSTNRDPISFQGNIVAKE